MIKILIFLALFFPNLVFAQQVGSTVPIFGQDACLWVETEDGTVANSYCAKMKVTDGSLTDNGDGTFSLTTGGGGGGGSGTVNSGTTNRAARYTGSTTVSSSTKIFDDATNVGIGTIAPLAAVDIARTLYVPSVGGNVGIGSTAPGKLLDVAGDMRISNSGHLTVEGVTSTGATGTGKFVFDGTPTLTTPVIGAATGTSLTLTGNLGVGSVNPTQAIDVNGTILTQSHVNLNHAAGSYNSVFFKEAGSNEGGLIGYGSTFGAPQSNTVEMNLASGVDFTVRNNSAEVMRVTTGSNVGIGDASPAAKFVVGNGDLFQVNSSGAIAASTGITTSGGYTQSGTTANTFTGTPTFSNATYSALFTGGNVGIGTTIPQGALAVMSGNVGIGTWVPSSIFNVAGNASTAATITGGVTINGSNGALLMSAGGAITGPTINGGTGSGSSLTLKSTSGAGTTDFIKMAVGSNGATEAMRIVNGGNVGIGTWIPSESLSISGNNTYGVTTLADATSITPNSHFKVNYQSNTQAAGTLTVNADSGAPVNGQSMVIKIKSTNAQTFSWNAGYVGGTNALPTTTTGSSKIDYFTFIYDSVNSKWDFTGTALGF